MQISDMTNEQKDRNDAVDLAIRILETSPGTLPHFSEGNKLAEYVAKFADGLKQYVLNGDATKKS